MVGLVDLGFRTKLVSRDPTAELCPFVWDSSLREGKEHKRGRWAHRGRGGASRGDKTGQPEDTENQAVGGPGGDVASGRRPEED